MKRIVILILTLMILLNGQSIQTFASEAPSFSATAIIPENQENKNISYYDLKMEPGQKQKIQLKITNSSKQMLTANIALNTAATEADAAIIYSKSDVEDESLDISISEIAKVKEPVVEIPAKSSKIVEVEIEMPDISFDGILLGGLYVTADTDTNEDSTSEGTGIEIKNEYAYAIGIKLSQTKVLVEPELNLKNITPQLINYHTAVAVNLQNSEKVIMKGVSIKAEVYKQFSSKVLHSTEITNGDIAPNSNFDILIDWENQALEDGKYRLRMIAAHKDKTWTWDEKFTIDKQAAAEVNSQALELEKVSSSFGYLLVIAVALLLLLFLAFRLGKRTAGKGEDN